MEFGACAVRGFITETWAMNVSESLQERPKRWTALADFPGEGRMGTACIIARDYPVSTAIVGAETSDRLERLFCWSGYNYTPLAADALPVAFNLIKSGGKSFNDGYSLGPDHAKDIAFPERWMRRREVDMPYRSGSSGIAYESVNSRVYLFGGCSFDAADQRIHQGARRRGRVFEYIHSAHRPRRQSCRHPTGRDQSIHRQAKLGPPGTLLSRRQRVSSLHDGVGWCQRVGMCGSTGASVPEASACQSFQAQVFSASATAPQSRVCGWSPFTDALKYTLRLTSCGDFLVAERFANTR